jgi:hypothetical protein
MLTASNSVAPLTVGGPSSASRNGQWPRWIILGLCSAVVGLSLVLTLGDGPGQVVVPLINRPLPPLCQMKMLTGLDCPGCGLTRSFIAIAHGQWREAFHFNPAGPLWFAFLALQIPYQALQLRRISRGKRPLDLSWWGQGMIYTCLAALILQWVVRQLGWL